jgi:hypothetical protein
MGVSWTRNVSSYPPTNADYGLVWIRPLVFSLISSITPLAE